jgi:uncharacterized membrane protein HdeD (DUF308 family)
VQPDKPPPRWTRLRIAAVALGVVAGWYALLWWAFHPSVVINALLAIALVVGGWPWERWRRRWRRRR